MIAEAGTDSVSPVSHIWIFSLDWGEGQHEVGKLDSAALGIFILMNDYSRHVLIQDVHKLIYKSELWFLTHVKENLTWQENPIVVNYLKPLTLQNLAL